MATTATHWIDGGERNRVTRDPEREYFPVSPLVLQPAGDDPSVDVAGLSHSGPEAEFFVFSDARYEILAND